MKPMSAKDISEAKAYLVRLRKAYEPRTDLPGDMEKMAGWLERALADMEEMAAVFADRAQDCDVARIAVRLERERCAALAKAASALEEKKADECDGIGEHDQSSHRASRAGALAEIAAEIREDAILEPVARATA